SPARKPTPSATPGPRRHGLLIPVDGVKVEGELAIPEQARGLVIFAHGSGSSRFSPRNQSVAQALRTRGLATLLFDLLTREEEEAEKWTGHYRFDIGLLARRLSAVTDWLSSREDTGNLKKGYFGSSTG